MEHVEPLRDPRQIAAIKAILRGQNLRDAAWFVLGINTGLRVGDLLRLTVTDVRISPSRWRDRVSVREQKTGKVKDFPLSETARKALQEYLSTRPEAAPSDPLFPSRKWGQPLSRKAAWAVLQRAAKMAGVTDAIGTHSMRKTFRYWAFKSGADLALIQSMLNHSSPATTLAYIGITRDDRDAVYRGLNL